MALVFVVLFILLILSVSTNVLQPNKTNYNDCYEINIRHRLKDGFYTLILNDEPVFTYCQNGSTLIQQRNPLSGNNRNYFERGLHAYKEGFGFAEKEMFLGLKNIFELNKNNNTILQVEATKQDDGSKIFIEFDRFVLLNETIDDMTYSLHQSDQTQIRNQTELYPIISLGIQSSIGVKRGQFILINPSYLKNLRKKLSERSEFKYYHDLLYASFTTFDIESNYQCARYFRSGWWYPFGLNTGNPFGLRQISKTGSKLVNEECQYNNASKFISNLNGMFDKNKSNNQRQLVLCLEKRTEDCIDANDYGWSYKNITVVKLTETKMWLKRSESEDSYKIIGSLRLKNRRSKKKKKRLSHRPFGNMPISPSIVKMLKDLKKKGKTRND